MWEPSILGGKQKSWDWYILIGATSEEKNNLLSQLYPLLFIFNLLSKFPCGLGCGEWIYIFTFKYVSTFMFFVLCVLILWSNRRSAIHRGRVWFGQVSVYFSIKMSAPPHKWLSRDFQISPRQISVNFCSIGQVTPCHLKHPFQCLLSRWNNTFISSLPC